MLEKMPAEPDLPNWKPDLEAIDVLPVIDDIDKTDSLERMLESLKF